MYIYIYVCVYVHIYCICMHVEHYMLVVVDHLGRGIRHDDLYEEFAPITHSKFNKKVHAHSPQLSFFSGAHDLPRDVFVQRSRHGLWGLHVDGHHLGSAPWENARGKHHGNIFMGLQ